MKTSDLPAFSLERIFDTSVSTLWNALTEKELMKQWHLDLEEFKPEVGFTFEFTSGPSPERQYVHLCEILEVIPEMKLKHSWLYKGYEGSSFLTFELFPEGAKTKLKLTHEGLDTFPNSNPDFDSKNFAIGWTEIIDKRLTEFLAKAID